MIINNVVTMKPNMSNDLQNITKVFYSDTITAEKREN